MNIITIIIFALFAALHSSLSSAADTNDIEFIRANHLEDLSAADLKKEWLGLYEDKNAGYVFVPVHLTRKEVKPKNDLEPSTLTKVIPSRKNSSLKHLLKGSVFKEGVVNKVNKLSYTLDMQQTGIIPIKTYANGLSAKNVPICEIKLSEAGQKQIIASTEVAEDDNTIMRIYDCYPENPLIINDSTVYKSIIAADLDRDGKPDMIINDGGENGNIDTLFLSSFAKGNDLVKKVAERGYGAGC